MRVAFAKHITSAVPCPPRATPAAAGSRVGARSPAASRPYAALRPHAALVAALTCAACAGAQASALALPSASALAASSGAATQGATAAQGTGETQGTSEAPSTRSSATNAPAAAATGASTTGGASADGNAPAGRRGGKSLATWFGPGFYGNKTACGQTLTPAVVGVASRTLACGTLVRVGYRGHNLTVPVLDRGPYGHNGASWDLTAGAAHALGIVDTVRITTAIVGSIPNGPLLGAPLEAGTPEAAGTGAEAAPSAGGASTSTSTTTATGGAAAS